LSLFAELAQIEGEDDFSPLGQVPLEWAETRVVGSAFHHGSYADVYSSEWIGILREEFAVFVLRTASKNSTLAFSSSPPHSLLRSASPVWSSTTASTVSITAPGSATMYAIGRFSSRSIQDRSSTSDVNRSGRCRPAGRARDPWPAAGVTMIGRFTGVVT
jgi:hypothetical protein